MDQHVADISDKWKLLPAYLKMRGVVKQHINSYNYFVDVELKKLLMANATIRSDADPNFFLRYLDIRVGRPCVQYSNIVSDITPMECRLMDITYAAPLVVDLEYTRGKQLIQRKDVEIARFPVMLRSNNCVLTEAERYEDYARMLECPHDPGGYFICRGAERVIMAQEQMSNNRILMDLDKNSNARATISSSTRQAKSRTIVYIKNKIMYLQHNSFTSDIPMVVIFKAFNIESDQELIHLVGLENLDIFGLSIEKCKEMQIYTQKQALRFISSKVRMIQSYVRRQLSTLDLALEVLSTVIFAHIPMVDGSFHTKSIFAATVIRRVLEVHKDPSKVDDRDYYGNKRLQLAGDLLSIMMEDLIKTFNTLTEKEITKSLKRQRRQGGQLDAVRLMKPDFITRSLETAIVSGNWRIKRFKMDRAGVTDAVTRLSYISSLGTMTKVTSQFEKTRKVSGPRSLQPSQFGMLCPSDTPEGESCGLLKNLALTTHVTTDIDEQPVLRTLFALGVERIELLSGVEAFNKQCYMILMNGNVIGVIRDPYKFVNRFRELRRKGKVSCYASIYYNPSQRIVYVNCDAGRLCRPLILVRNGMPCLKKKHLDLLEMGLMNFNDFVDQGIIEYLDVNEENGGLIAADLDDISQDSTHLEIDPLTLLGVCAGLIPYPHHNQSPRNTYQSVMGKQAMGAISYNQLRRFETVMYLLCYPQKPLVKTKTIEFVGFENLPAGHNAMVAVMSYSGYDIEDAIILNRSSLDRGFGRCMVVKKQKVFLRKYANGAADRITVPEYRKGKFGGIDLDGIANVGSVITKGDILVHREVPVHTEKIVMDEKQQFRPMFERFKGPCVSVVQEVMLTSNPTDHFLLKLNIRSTRRPERGDKFSSRHGQKGVCGLIVNQEDMPFNDSGICPDLIMNPHGFPSRMTVGKMIELIAGKAGVLEGEFKYGTAFGGNSVEEVGSLLVKHGFSFTGKDTVTSGITGEQLQAYIFMGPIYYQKLKHMVMDKIHARSTGPRANLTRQPTAGRSNEGGLRLGEMERDCLIGYGASLLLQERLMLSSDKFDVLVCEVCGLIGHENVHGKVWCQYCKNGDHLSSLEIPYATKLLFQEMMSMGIMPRIRMKNL